MATNFNNWTGEGTPYSHPDHSYSNPNISNAAGSSNPNIAAPIPRHGSYASDSPHPTTNTPLPQQQDTTPFLAPPDLPFLDHSVASTPRGSAAYTEPDVSGSRANLTGGGEKGFSTPLMKATSRPWYKRPLFWLLTSGALVVVVLAVILPVYFVVIKPNQNDTASSPSGASTGGGGSTSNGDSGKGGGKNGGNNLVTTGGDGSTVTKEDGSTFVYHNQFGGFWVDDPEDPFNDNAQANSWTPPLNASWKWGVDRINGVNLGGLFVLEPFITPSFYQQFNGQAEDEWTLSTSLGDKLQQTLEDHYNTFITEEDIAQIAGAGLNWIRLPIPFWAIETWDNVGVDASGNTVAEPFLQKVAWKYIVRVLQWARKYGLRVNLDLHTVPGSQNGYNHSGKLGKPNFLNGVMGIANAQRALDYIRTITEFISQPEYQNVVPVFGIVNEALVQTIGQETITAFYLHAHNMIRSITGVGEGKGPYIAIHDGFIGVSKWANFLQGSDRIILDTHPYFAFDGQPNNEPINVPATGGDGSRMGGKWPQQACQAWGASLNSSRSQFGVTVAGEFSNGFNDCGLFVNGVANGPVSTADCAFYSDSTQWDQNTKDGLKTYAMASMDALGDWFFWTWKIGNSTAGSVQAPLWSYKLGLDNGWMPTDPREARGLCASLGVAGEPFVGTFSSWQTGGAGAGTIVATSTEQFGSWPPTSIANVPAAEVTSLPTYTSTKSINTLPPLTPTPAPTKSVDVGSGWANSADTASYVTAVSGCTYPNAWDAVSTTIPISTCMAVTRLNTVLF
ncbi:glycoside hydrolase [Panus rudis PR-1116 ss-1]|nr:glycoside hydrolase [Panus rudis PR-1116 ss-1]